MYIVAPRGDYIHLGAIFLYLHVVSYYSYYYHEIIVISIIIIISESEYSYSSRLNEVNDTTQEDMWLMVTVMM